MASIGETLRRARLDQSLDLAEVAARTKINLRYLEAIEADDRSGLPPGSFFYKSFVHQYAGVLLIDPRDLDAAVERIISADAPLPLPGQDHPIQKVHVLPILSARRRPFEGQRVFLASIALVLAVAGCGGLYAWWAKTATATVAVHKETKQEPASQEPAEFHAAATKPQTVEKAPEKGPSERVAAVFDRILVEVLAREQVWVSLTADGRRIFTGVLHTDEKRSVEARDFARLRVGNSAGLEVHWNGQALGEIGPRGQVRVVNFRRDKFEIAVPGPLSQAIFNRWAVASLDGGATITLALDNE